MFISTLIDKLLTSYAYFPYLWGKWNIIKDVIPLCQPRWKESRRAKRRGLIWELDLNDIIQRNIYYYGHYESRETKLLESILEPGMVFLDVGAV